MKRSEILALWFLLRNKSGDLKKLSDYVSQFEVIEKEFADILRNMGKPND